MKTRLSGVLAGILTLGVLAASVAACGGSTASVSTLAGTPGSKGSADGRGTAARFNDPFGVACDAAGNVYVADFANFTIRKITPAGEVTTLAGKAGSRGSVDGSGTAARFDHPSGIACDAAGNLYVTDSFTIRKITPAGTVTTLAGNAADVDSYGSVDGSGAAARFRYPTGIACDAAANLYVTDSNTTIRKITPAGMVTTLAGKTGIGGSADGRGAAARFSDPYGIACDAAGNLYVTEYGNFTVRKITPAGEVSTLAGKAGSMGSADGSGAAARFQIPEGIASDGAGNLYVTDTGNCTIRKITPAGDVTTLAGKAGTEGSADGRGAAARFVSPFGIARDAAGNLYVADSGNDTIRKIALSH